ncbi:hypothetical protein B0J12DRAFT_326922 [Macrophomina phaseolina]|uniref:Uncharacterized protein n=1 Tax=Macrophomina phaseolina TaxID=35725 RepID=A0ABQ8FV71_9PEZI|nr:hypothetical protein B0J12DRAFT_326922 [Macrophomina phaseolina]
MPPRRPPSACPKRPAASTTSCGPAAAATAPARNPAPSSAPATPRCASSWLPSSAQRPTTAPPSPPSPSCDSVARNPSAATSPPASRSYSTPVSASRHPDHSRQERLKWSTQKVLSAEVPASCRCTKSYFWTLVGLAMVDPNFVLPWVGCKPRPPFFYLLATCLGLRLTTPAPPPSLYENGRRAEGERECVQKPARGLERV